MPATELQNSFLGRISIRRNQIASMEDQENEEDIDNFAKNVCDRFADLLSPPPSDEPILSINWLRRLLDVFLCCDAEFKVILIMGRDPSQVIKPPLDRILPEFLDRAVKALDICNAVTHGIESIRYCQNLAEIAITALEQRPLGEGQVRRAKKSLSSMLTLMTQEDKENTNSSKFAERSWSFGRRGGGGGGGSKERAVGQFRSVSWSVSKTWSAAKQIHWMMNNLAAPRGAEATGMALPVYIMNTVTGFVMWALVAALPCQDRNGLTGHFPVPKQFAWAQPVIGLHEKIGEEWKKKEKKGSAGLLDEMQRMEKSGQWLVDFTEGFEYPGEEEWLREVVMKVVEMKEYCRRMEEGLVPLQLQIREVFHRIVRSRAEFLEALDQAGKMSGHSI